MAIIGASRSTHYMAIKRSALYRAAFAEAQEDFADLVRGAATHRAIKGVKRMKFYRGRPCMVPVRDKDGKPVLEQYEEVIYSDGLLVLLLRAYCPEFALADRQGDRQDPGLQLRLLPAAV